MAFNDVNNSITSGAPNVKTPSEPSNSKVYSNGLQLGSVLTKTEEEVRGMLVNDFLTPKQISIRREISKQAVYKIIRNITKKGYDLKRFTKVISSKPLSKPVNLKHGIRLHGQEFNIKVLYSSRFYLNLIKEKNIIYEDNNTIRLFENSIEVYCNEELSFIGEDEQRATSLSFNYFNKIFQRIQSRLKVIFLKGNNTSIKQVNAHYSEINNELAKECNEKKVYITIYATEDGKAWFKIDNSFNLNEAECIKPESAKQDIQRVKSYFNDIRDNLLPLPSEQWQLLATSIKNNSMMAENFKSHIAAIQTLSSAVNEFKETVKSFYNKPISELCTKLLNAIKTKEDVFMYRYFIMRLNESEKALITDKLFKLGNISQS